MDADYYELPDGSVSVRWRETCARGHPATRCGTGLCPRCRVYTRLYYCDDVRCRAAVTSYAHENVCPA